MNLATVIEGHPDDRVALVTDDRVMTYGELRGDVAHLVAGLTDLGIASGDRVALLLPNDILFVVAYLATLTVGAVALPVNPAGAAAEIEQELGATGARLAVVGAGASDAFRSVDRSRVALEHVLVPEGVALEEATPLNSVRSEQAAWAATERTATDVAVMIFTAGTAGAPKAALLTHGNLLANLEQIQAHPGRALRADDVSLGVLPFFHIFGLNVVLGLSLYAGASVVVKERFDATESLDAIRTHNVTVLAGAPPMFAAWNALEASTDSMRSVRLAVSGAAKLPEDVAAEFRSRFGITVAEGYGLTEASPVVTSSVGDEPRSGSIGLPLTGVEVRLVDDEGDDALVGDPGEIWVRGPNVFAGYLDEPEATARVLTPDGWLRTGDIAVADADGYLYIVDRAKDLVIVSGFNVYPAEVEAALLEHPDVAEAVVVGVPHAESGEAVKAYVVRVPGTTVTIDDLSRFCAERLARYKCPTSVEFVDAIPRGLAGKALRRALR